MEKYKNTKSSITGYEIKNDSILIEFKGGSRYEYNYKITGQLIVETMKVLAKKGEGLTSYIHKNAKSNYIKK